MDYNELALDTQYETNNGIALNYVKHQDGSISIAIMHGLERRVDIPLDEDWAEVNAFAQGLRSAI